MDKNTYLKIKKAIIICLLILFCINKVSEFYSDDILDKIVFYDLPETVDGSQEIDSADRSVIDDLQPESIRSIPVENIILIDINTADAEQLQLLDKIGPVLASRIIEYRDCYGAFVSIEEIKEVKGIGDKIYEAIKEHIVVYP